MKTQIVSKALLVTFLLVTLSSSIWAENTEYVKVSVIPGKKVLIHVYNLQKQPLSIEIMDSETSFKVYTSEQPGESVSRKVYNLSNLPAGNYTIGIKFGNKVFEKEVQINDYICILLDEKEFIVPEFEIEDKNLLITFPGSENEKVDVSFLNDSEMFFKDEAVNWKVSKRKYNLAELLPGDYKVVLSSDDKSYSYYFDLK
jgi:hypothetical protein